jgi:glycosyltransferase involved in cell wall biosynthesis
MDIAGGAVALSKRLPWIVSERSSAKMYSSLGWPVTLRRFLARRASAIIANSNMGQDYWRSAGGGKGKVFVVRNALEVQAIRATQARTTQFQGKPLFLVVGRFSEEKALEIVVEAISRLSDPAAHFLFMGDGPTRQRIESQIVELGLSERISLSSYQHDWWGWLKAAEGLISMSRFEGSPNVVLEAMAGGCPVILSDIPAHQEIADEQSASFVPVDDAHALASAIEAAIKQRASAAKRSSIAQQRIAFLTVGAAAAAHKRIYQEILDDER